jgi:hypothetical protein
MTDKLEALKASARGIARLLGDIASFDSWDIDGDIVDIRFEDENGCDTGADVSITETADKASQAISELLAALEEANKRAELESVGADKSAVNAVEWMKRANAAEQREEHLKADVDVKNNLIERLHQQAVKDGNRLAELDRKNAELNSTLERWATGLAAVELCVS